MVHGATYYVSTTGNNASAGTSAGAAWATIDRALDSAQAVHTVAGDLVLIEAGTYSESPTIDVAAAINSVITLRGTAASFAAATPGTQPVTIAGSVGTSLGSGTAGYYRFENIAQGGQSATGWNLGNLTFCSWVFCTANNNSGASSDGFSVRANCSFFGCTANGNGRDGFDAGRNTGGQLICIGCVAKDNAAYGFNGYTNHLYANCLAHNNATAGFHSSIANTQVWCINCTADGNGIGYNLRGGRDCTLVNSLVTNNTTGIVGEIGVISQYNVFYSNTADTSSWATSTTDRTATDPLYVDRTGDDFRLKAASPARGTAYPLYMDAGYLQSRPRLLMRQPGLTGGTN